MEELDYWRLCEELNIVQAALLVVSGDPKDAEWIKEWDSANRPKGYDAAQTALCTGLKNYTKYIEEVQELTHQTESIGLDYSNPPDLVAQNKDYLDTLLKRSIEGTLVPEFDTDMNGNPIGIILGTVDVYKSTINVQSLKEWLKLKGFSSGFFFPEKQTTLDFLDPLNSRYAPKLAAAVNAWQAVTESGKRSPKQALDKWLREHAVEFGLTNDEGKPIETAIEECSKVANWNPKGGATKTPT